MVKKIDTDDFTKEEIIEILNEIKRPVDIAVFDSCNYFNFGAMIRTAHNFLVKKIYAVGIDEYYTKATMGANKWEKQNIIKLEQEEFFKTVHGRQLVAMERRPGLETETLLTFSWPRNPIIIFGGEKTGLNDEILQKCQHVVSIPVYSLLNDYNVAQACAITLYDWTSKYLLNKG